MKNNKSSLITISQKGTEEFKEIGSKFETTYFEFIYEAPIIIPASEINDEEMLKLAHDNKEFAYLENPEEDIYSISDGTPL
jgi:hypothetical protein